MSSKFTQTERLLQALSVLLSYAHLVAREVDYLTGPRRREEGSARYAAIATLFPTRHQGYIELEQSLCELVCQAKELAKKADPELTGPAPVARLDRPQVRVGRLLHDLHHAVPPGDTLDREAAYGEVIAERIRFAARAVTDLYNEISILVSSESGAGADTEEPSDPRLSAMGEVSNTSAAPDEDRPTFRCEGKMWRLSFGGEAASFPSSEGLRRIHSLLLKEGREVSALTLFGMNLGSEGDRLLGDLGVEDLERRKVDLQQVIESDPNPEEVAAAREEMDVLETHVSAATGPGRKGRNLGNQIKAASSAVGNSIRRAVAAIRSELPDLADHLTVSIVGAASASPVYRPGQKVNWML